MFSRFVGMSTLFGISIQHFFFFFQLFFFKVVLLPYISLLKIWWEPFLFSSFWHFSFFFLNFLNFFFLLWILTQTTTLKQTDQIPSWNTMDKGFKKERLIKKLNGVTSDNVSKKKNTYMAQSRQKWPNLISQRLV